MRRLAAVRAEAGGRDSRTGRFTEGAGNRGAAQTRLLHVDHAQVAPWMRDALRGAERRFRGMKTSGLLRACGTRCDGILRGACVADAMHDALAAHAVTLADVRAAREVMADARGWAREARISWLKLFAICGVRRGDATDKDPLRALAEELGGEGIEGDDDD